MPTRNLLPELWGRKAGNPLTGFRQAMDRLFEDWSEAGFLDIPRVFGENNLFGPQVDVAETEKEIRINAELPGLDEKDIHINVMKDRLTLKGEKNEEKEEKGKNFYRRERSFGSFHREIILPCEVEGEKASATFKKGVLTITVPKSPEAQKAGREIPIRAE